MPSPDEMVAALRGTPLGQYPTSEDAAFARQHDWSYGQPFAGPWFGGTKLRALSGDPNAVPLHARDVPLTNSSSPQLTDYYAKAALAANRSALGMLGFDPSQVAADVDRDPTRTNILGKYRPSTDQTYANALDPSAIVHESIHRGIQKLRESPYWNKAWTDMPSGSLPNELAVRYLMAKKMGDPEHYPIDEKQKAEAIDYYSPNLFFNRLKQLNDMEAAAAKYIAAKQPRGPR